MKTYILTLVMVLFLSCMVEGYEVSCGMSASSSEPVIELLTDEQIRQLQDIAEEQGLGEPVIELLTDEQIRQLQDIAEEQGLGDE